jgi:hypothetical protein
MFIPLNDELIPTCHFLALLGVHFLHVSRIRVNIFFEKPTNTEESFLNIRHFTYNRRNNVTMHNISYADE